MNTIQQWAWLALGFFGAVMGGDHREIGVDHVQRLAHPRAVALQQRLHVRDVFALHEQDAEHAAQLIAEWVCSLSPKTSFIP